MALVTDRLNANKPATPEPKPGKVSSAQLNNNKDLDVDIKKEEPSFFGSFFNASKSQQQKAKKGPQPMEAVRTLFSPISILTCLQTVDMQPPAIIRPQAALNERETLETEVISAYPSIVFLDHALHQCSLTHCRAAHPLVFQYRQARDDRHGAKGHHAHTCKPLEREPAARAAAGALQTRRARGPTQGERTGRHTPEGGRQHGTGAQQGGGVRPSSSLYVSALS